MLPTSAATCDDIPSAQCDETFQPIASPPTSPVETLKQTLQFAAKGMQNDSTIYAKWLGGTGQAAPKTSTAPDVPDEKVSPEQERRAERFRVKALSLYEMIDRQFTSAVPRKIAYALLDMMLNDQGAQQSLLEERLCGWAYQQEDPEHFFQDDIHQGKRQHLQRRIEKLERVKQMLP